MKNKSAILAAGLLSLMLGSLAQAQQTVVTTQDIEEGRRRMQDLSDEELRNFRNDLNRRKDNDWAQNGGKPGPSNDYLWKWVKKVEDELRRREYLIEDGKVVRPAGPWVEREFKDQKYICTCTYVVPGAVGELTEYWLGPNAARNWITPCTCHIKTQEQREQLLQQTINATGKALVITADTYLLSNPGTATARFVGQVNTGQTLEGKPISTGGAILELGANTGLYLVGKGLGDLVTSLRSGATEPLPGLQEIQPEKQRALGLVTRPFTPGEKVLRIPGIDNVLRDLQTGTPKQVQGARYQLEDILREIDEGPGIRVVEDKVPGLGTASQ